MSKRYFTSDLHFNSTLINKYAKRPHQEALKAGEFLIDNANAVLSSEDILIHAGDFCLTSVDRHGKEEDIPLSFSPDYWKTQIKARLVLLTGNHDDGHSFEADCKSMVLDLNQNYRNVYVNHFPSDHPDYHGPRNAWKHNAYDINLCGHVHDKWLLKWDAERHVLNINVGTDVWGYKPVRDAEITNLLDFVTGKKIEKTGYDLTSSFTETREDYDAFVQLAKIGVQRAREQRREDKLKKKGLTLEECERRKIEAMKKKGLI